MLDLFCKALTLMSWLCVVQGQWRLIKLSGITHDWDAVIANVLGLGTATMLAWHALNHRLPFNRSLALSLLQFCLLVGTNGLIVDAMRTEWPDKLEASACHAHVCCVSFGFPLHATCTPYLAADTHVTHGLVLVAGGIRQG